MEQREAARRKAIALLPQKEKKEEPPGPKYAGFVDALNENQLNNWGRGKRAWKEARRAKRQIIRVNKTPPKHRPKLMGLFDMFIPKDDGKPKSPFANSRRFADYLVEKKGFKSLGAGFYSRVIAKPNSDKVLKISDNSDNWIDYAYWAAKEGFAGSFAPKVYSYKKIKIGDGGTITVSVMERLPKTLSEDDDGTKDAHVVNALFGYGVRGNQKAQEVADTFSPGMKTFITKFSSEFGKGHLDLHGGNIMIRNDGSFCLTDPVTGASKIKQTRLKLKDFTLH